MIDLLLKQEVCHHQMLYGFMKDKELKAYIC